MSRPAKSSVLLLVASAGLLAMSACSVRTSGEASSSPESPEASTSLGNFPTPPLPYTLRQGKALFLHYCSTCHGVEGRGDGFNAFNLDPKPRDLADPAFHQKRSDEDLRAIIRTGGGAIGLSTAMPPWGNTLNDRQIGQLVQFVRQLPESTAPEDAEESP